MRDEKILTHILKIEKLIAIRGFYIFLLLLALCFSETLAFEKRNITFVTVKGTIGAVNCFMQDAQGQIWLGSKEGMLESDGITVSRNLRNIEHELKKVSVNNILNSGNNTYYIGTSEGMYKIFLESETYEFIYETAAMEILSLFRFDEDNIILGTPYGPYNYTVSTGLIRQIEGFDNSPVRGMVKANNSLAIANAQGITFVDTRYGCERLNTLNDPVEALAFDYRSGILFAATKDALFSIELRNDSPTSTQVVKANDITTIFIDSDERLWLGTKSGILYRGDKNDKFSLLQHDPIDRYSLIDNAITCFFEDQGKNIWVGTKRGVSLYHHDKPIISHTLTDSKDNPLGIMPSTIYKDSKGRLWIGSLGALYLNDINSDENKAIQIEAEKLKGLLIRDIFEDKRGNVWFCTDKGLCRCIANNKLSDFIYFTNPTQEVFSDIIYSCTQIDDDNLAVGCISSGIFFVHLNDLENAKNSPVKAYYWKNWEDKRLLDPDNTLAKLKNFNNEGVITPTGSGIVMQVSAEKYGYHHSIDHTDQLHVSTSTCTHYDSNEKIWIGGIGHLGRINLKTNRVESIDDKDLLSRNVIGIERQEDNLWIIFSDGLGLWNPITDGVEIIANFNEPLSCSFYNEKEQNLYLGLSGKYCTLDLKNILKYSVYENLVYFTSLSVNNEYVRVGHALDDNEILSRSLPFVDKITLKSNQNNLTIKFVDGIRHPVLAAHYKYRLKGNNDEWIEMPQDQKNITLSGLRPGKYLLELQRTDILKASQIPQPEAKLAIEILHPWWSNGYAQCAYALIALIMMEIGYKYYKMRNSLKLSEFEKKKALELSNMKTEFLTNMSHEIKTPLTFMLDNINALLNSTRNNSQLGKVKSLHENTMRIKRIVHDMLNVEDEIPSDARKFKIELKEFLESIVATYLPMALQKQIDLKTNLPENPIYISGDPMKLEIAIGNLMTNAVKFTANGGSIQVDLSVEGEITTITVKDSGIGIKEKDIPFIFNRFYQGENPEINKDGSGIGLSTTQKYIESMSGTVEVSSRVGYGSTFIVKFPILAEKADEENELIISDESEEAIEKRHSILIVEDNDEICQMLVKSLNRYDCILAHNGKSGLEKAIASQPDVIISDIMMPIMDGIHMLKGIRRNVNTHHIPVIMLTAKDNKATQNEAIALGVDLFISKPFDPRMLLGYINRIIVSRSNIPIQKDNAAENLPSAPALTQQEAADRKFLEEINKLIEVNLNDSEFNVEKLSTITGYNSKHLYRRLKTLTGETTVGYIQSIRLKKAAAMLRQRHYTVSEVMYAVGFSNASYFSKCFSAKYGVTPSEYVMSI